MIKKDNRGKKRKELSNRRTLVLMGSIFSNETFSPKIFLFIFIFLFLSLSISANFGIGGNDKYGIGDTSISSGTTFDNSSSGVNSSSYWGTYLYSDYDMPIIKSYAYNQTSATFPFINTASTNLQSNISAVNTSLMIYCNNNFTSLNTSLKYNYNQSYTSGTYNATYHGLNISYNKFWYNQSYTSGTYNSSGVYTTNTSWKNLTEDNMADSLHRHSELSASDGSPNPALSVDASGNVGIGITTPRASLNVYGTSYAQTATNPDYPEAVFRVTGSATNVIDMGTSPNSPYPVWIQGRDRTNGALQYPLSLNANGGNVGIGTTSPQSALDVKGNQNITGSLQVTKNITLTGASSLIKLPSITIGTCDTGTNGSIARNDTGLYLCKVNSAWSSPFGV